MTYDEARNFVEITKQYGSVLGLESIAGLMDKLSNVQNQLPVIHVAGTNGKGSTCAMIAEILKEAGYRVGRYSSPAVFSYEEIFQVNGVPITQEDYVTCMEQVKPACEVLVAEGKPHPTSFEVETALAFVYFAMKQCDIVVLETGMGGATDATNLILSPVCSVLTDISRDHMGFLGDTLEEIAKVKAGIIKQNSPVVTVMQKPEVMQVIRKEAMQKEAALVIAEDARIRKAEYHADGMEIHYTLRNGKMESAGNGKEADCDKLQQTDVLRLHMALSGSHQVRNALLALTVAEVLTDAGYRIGQSHILAGMKKVRWNGRFETICRSPRIIIDGAHNEGAAEKLKESIQNCFTNQPITYIIGVLGDKEHEKMLRILLPYARKVYTITPDNPRGLPGEKLAEEAGMYHSDVEYVKSVKQAVKQAADGAAENEVILAFGSLSYLEQVKEAVRDSLHTNAEWR